MFEIRPRLWMMTFILVHVLFSCLEAVQIKTEFYPAGNIPEEYAEVSDGRDSTVITLDELPAKSTISMFETRLMPNKTKKLGTKKLKNETSFALVVSPLGYVPGVPVTFTFKDSKKNLKKEINCIPNRLYVKSLVDHAQVEAKLVQVNPVMYSVVLEGFDEKEELLFKSISYDEKIERPIDKKLSSIMVMPGVINKSGGIARLSITRPSGEVLKLELPWGFEWMKYMTYYGKDGEIKSITDDSEFLRDNPQIAEYFNSKR